MRYSEGDPNEREKTKVPLPFIFVCYEVKNSRSITVYQGHGTFTWNPEKESIGDCLETFDNSIRARLSYDLSFAIVYKSVSKIN